MTQAAEHTGISLRRKPRNPSNSCIWCFGGELKSLDSNEFRDPSKIDVVGIFPNYASAERAWRSKAQASVDSAQTRYFIVHLHRFLEPAGLLRKTS